MCEPATIMAGLTAVGSALSSTAGVAALTIGSAAMTGIGQVQQYQDAKYNAKAQRSAALAAFEGDTAAITNRQLQEGQSASQRLNEQQSEFRAARASAIVNAEDAGVTGLSVDALLNDLTGQQAKRTKATNQNLQMAIAQLQEQKGGAGVQLASRTNAARSPSMSSLMIGLGGTALDAANSYTKRTKP